MEKDDETILRPKFSEALLSAVAQIELKARRNVNALLAGNYRSTFRGSGMQFKEFRHYEAGDDIRHMSWPVTARTGRPTVKVYEEERELDVLVMVDVSGSSLFGSKRQRKIDMYLELTALIGLAAVKSGDRVGLMLFHEEPVFYMPPRRSRDQVLIALTQLLSQPLRGKRSDLRPALLSARQALKHRALVIVISDFQVPAFENEMRMMARRHEMILLHCFDDAEQGNSLHGVMEVCDPETGELYLLDGNSKHTRQSLLRHQLDLRNELETMSRGCRADSYSLSVDDDYLQRLVLFFRQRGPARL